MSCSNRKCLNHQERHERCSEVVTQKLKNVKRIFKLCEECNSVEKSTSLTNILKEKKEDTSIKMNTTFLQEYRLTEAAWSSYLGRLKGSSVFFGEYALEPKYTQHFNTDLNIYICSKCFISYHDVFSINRHRQRCNITYPSGKYIYKDESLALFKIDGLKLRFYCQRLCMIAKFFLKDKTLYYDVETFEFFVLFDQGAFVGYFSRQKNFPKANLSCIFVLPHYQRQGYGYLLIDASYRFQKKNCRGTPERPLSEKGLKVYQKYWKTVVYNILLEQKGKVSISQISKIARMTVDDVIYAMELLGIIKNDSFSDINVPDLGLSPPRVYREELFVDE